MQLDILKNLGLTDGEVKVYQILLESGELSAGELIKKTALKRGDCYNKIYDLKKKGLIEEFSKNKKKFFKLEHPNYLKDYLDNRVKGIEDTKKELDMFLPEILSRFTLVSNKPGVRYFEGIEGIKQAYLDTLDAQTQETGIKALISPSDPHPDLAKWLKSVYVHKRIRMGIKASVVASRSSTAESYQQRDQFELRETRLVSDQQYPFEMEIDIYGGNRVAFISFKKDEMVAFIIESKAVYQTMKAFFELNWVGLI
ncbi:MAG: Transcriptional regulator, TrmB [uncultured bacterium]|nr:MAG: Transcriptional regulator, TrmB [uncultured bacterium]